MKALRTAFLLFALPAALLGLAPAAFVGDRAAILQGEWWRLWTGHWVHFSPSHLAWNLAVLLAAGTWLEHLRPGLLARFAFAGAPLISLGLFALSPALLAYGGLSGLATGVVVLLALVHLASRRSDRGWWITLLALVAAKLAWDAGHATPLFSRFAPGAYQPSSLAHALGAALAVPVFLSHRPALPAPFGQPAP
jgi:rhomboid family GlyGly-CTERM serine protease